MLLSLKYPLNFLGCLFSAVSGERAQTAYAVRVSLSNPSLIRLDKRCLASADLVRRVV